MRIKGTARRLSAIYTAELTSEDIENLLNGKVVEGVNMDGDKIILRCADI